jgi:hypothetical protein
MNELKGKQGLKQESLIHFHRVSLHMAFPFGNPKHLPQTLEVTLQAQEDYGDFLYSLIYNTGGVVLIRWLIIGVVDELRGSLRSCLHGGVVDGVVCLQ